MDKVALDRGFSDFEEGLPFEVTDVFWMTVKVWDDYRTIVHQGGTSSSKCLGKGTKVRMFDLSLKNVEDIVVGDELLGTDGNPRKVLKLYSGIDDLYQIEQDKGIDFVCNSNHLLVFQTIYSHKLLTIEAYEYFKMPLKEKALYRGIRYEESNPDLKILTKVECSFKGKGEYFGFEIDGDHLFFLEDYTVTHNTYSILQWLFLKAAESKIDILVVGQDIPNLKLGAYKDFQTIWKTNEKTQQFIINWHKNDMEFTFFNGSKIKFTSVKDGQDAKSGKRDILFVNEANGIPYDVYRQLSIRARLKVVIDYNPSAAFWAHSKVIPKENAKLIISDYRHNKFCSPEIVEEIEAYKDTDAYLWRVYGRGATGQVEGLIFPNVEFISDAEFPDIEDLRMFGYGADYGYSCDPNTLVMAGVYQGAIYCKLLLYLKSGKDGSIKLEDLVAEWEELIEENYYSTIAFDNSQAREQADKLRDYYGFNVVAANRRGGSIISGINLLKDFKIYIVDDEDNHFYEERQKYLWKRVNGENTKKPRDSYNHCFSGDTMILTTEGWKEIKNVEIGDYVYNSHTEECRVINSFLSKENAINYLYTIDVGYRVIEIRCTEDHEIRINDTWKAIKCLTKGDSIHVLGKDRLNKQKVLKVTKKLMPLTDVYDLSVLTKHEFIANGILVHNCWDSLRYWGLENLTKPEIDEPSEMVVLGL